jgi:3-deoxy-D-manno-octulosonic-acid transferase
MFSVPGIAAELQAENAALVVDNAETLAAAIGRLLEDRPAARAMAAAARNIAERNRNVLDRAFAVLDPLIDRARSAAAS